MTTWAEWKRVNWQAMQERDARLEAERRAPKAVDLKEEKKRRRRLRAMARIAARVAHDTAVMNAFLDSPEGQEWLAELSTEPEPSRLSVSEKSPGASRKPKPAPG